MITVRVEGFDQALAKVSGLGKQVKFATAVALTRTAKAVKDAVPAAMERELDRPTPFSKSGLYIQAARPERLQAVVGFMDRQAKYMAFQIEGGTRQAGPHGIKLPGNIQLNTFGNIPKGVIAQLKAAAQSGELSKTIARRLGTGNRRKGAAPIQLFFGRPAGSRWSKAPIGIWRRVPGNPGKLIPVVVFEQRPVHYRARFNPEAAARRIVARHWPGEFSASLADALRTAR